MSAVTWDEAIDALLARPHYDNPLPAVEVSRYAGVLCSLLTALDREIVDAAIVGDGESDLLHPERELVDSFREVLDRRFGVALELNRNRSCGLAFLDAFSDELLTRMHSDTPVNGADSESTSGMTR